MCYVCPRAITESFINSSDDVNTTELLLCVPLVSNYLLPAGDYTSYYHYNFSHYKSYSSAGFCVNLLTNDLLQVTIPAAVTTTFHIIRATAALVFCVNLLTRDLLQVTIPAAVTTAIVIIHIIRATAAPVPDM